MKTGPVPSNRVSFFGAALALACAAPLFIGACSGEETSPPAGGGPIAVESIRTEIDAAFCEFYVRCGLMPDAKTCGDVKNSEHSVLQLLADVVYGTVTYDASAARSCVNAVKGLACDGLASSMKAMTDTCETVFKGTVPEGGSCVVNDECQGDSTCDFTESMGDGVCKLGVCAPKEALVALGGDCTMGTCVPEAYCDQGNKEKGDTPTCAARADNGEPCNAADACLEGQRCDIGGDGKGNCYKLSDEGKQCNPTLKSGSCRRFDNWCESTEEKCVKLPGAGEACAKIDDKMVCLPYAYCDDMSMTCKSRGLVGEACALNDPGSCLGDLRCVHDDMAMKDTCERPPPASVCVLGDEAKAP